ncbi:MAG: head-tail adaptor, partial [Proteobacteria bacterium]|nr:head-tail adaptor [Pseudomonadota bacterium]
LGREMQNDVREQIFAAFFRNVLNLPIDAPSMTATEVLERKDEFIRTIGPVFGRLEADYNTPVVERSFRILMRAGAFPEAPEILNGRDVRFEYASPVEQARMQIESAGFARHLELMAPLAAMQPEIWDNYDGDEIARDGPSVHGFPSRYVRPRKDVEAARQARAQAQQAQALLDGAGQAAKLAGAIQGLGQETA